MSCTFQTAFDITQQGYSPGGFLFVGALFILIGGAMLFRPEAISFAPAGFRGHRLTRALGCLIFPLAVVWTGWVVQVSYSDYRRAIWALNHEQASAVEGVVTDFIPDTVPKPHSKSRMESFVVNGQRFSYSAAIVTSGFRQTVSNGGPIREGLHVRITHLGNLILRLEVADCPR